ncbi:MAG: HEAT repeat domain-containing protein [Deltaproteobacteria bacterium]|nr:HEAT repeat domain-containing protein [Deltaproteobacteria bacterium]
MIGKVLLEDPSPKVRAQAALTLGRIKEDGSADFLLKALKDEDPIVKGSAVKALGMLGAGGAFHDVCELAAEKDKFVSKWAAESARILVRYLKKLHFDINSLTADVDLMPDFAAKKYQESLLYEILKFPEYSIGKYYDFVEENASNNGKVNEVVLKMSGAVVELALDDQEATGKCGVTMSAVIENYGIHLGSGSESAQYEETEEYTDEELVEHAINFTGGRIFRKFYEASLKK